MADLNWLDEILAPQIMNEDTCPECYVNFTEAKANILSKLEEAIGEDDEHTANGRLTAYKRGRKSLRAEIKSNLGIEGK